MTNIKLLEACNYAKKFFKEGFFKSNPKSNGSSIIVLLPYPYMSISGTMYDNSEFMFDFDERAKRFYFWSYYVSDRINLFDNQNDEILNHIKL